MGQVAAIAMKLPAALLACALASAGEARAEWDIGVSLLFRADPRESAGLEIQGVFPITEVGTLGLVARGHATRDPRDGFGFGGMAGLRAAIAPSDAVGGGVGFGILGTASGAGIGVGANYWAFLEVRNEALVVSLSAGRERLFGNDSMVGLTVGVSVLWRLR
jgi:hypothetical protein